MFLVLCPRLGSHPGFCVQGPFFERFSDHILKLSESTKVKIKKQSLYKRSETTKVPKVSKQTSVLPGDAWILGAADAAVLLGDGKEGLQHRLERLNRREARQVLVVFFKNSLLKSVEKGSTRTVSHDVSMFI